VLRLFEKTPDQVKQSEWELLTARVSAFASSELKSLFTELRPAATWDRSLTDDGYDEKVRTLESLHRQIESRVAFELQGRSSKFTD
jgi:hypothetical protein